MDVAGASVRGHAPQAEIVIDNYHVVALATKALGEVRHEHWNELRAASRGDAAKAFERARWSLLKQPEHLTDRQARRSWIEQAGVARALRAVAGPGSRRRKLDANYVGPARRR